MYNTETYFKTEANNNRLAKFWSAFVNEHSGKTKIPMSWLNEDGTDSKHWLSLDGILSYINTDLQLDESNLLDYLFQPQFSDLVAGDVFEGADGTSTISVTLGDLASVFGNEQDYNLRQFDITDSRVNALVTDIVKHKRLYLPLTLGYVGTSGIELDNIEALAHQLVLVSGRHRLSALLTIVSKIEDWQDLRLFVNVKKFASEAELATFIQIYNGSRSMSTQEKNVLAVAQEGYDPNNNDDLFAMVKDSLAAVNRAFELYFINTVDVKRLDITKTTAGLIGRGIAAALRQKLDKNVRKFLRNPEISKEIAETAVDTISNQGNWNLLRELCKRTVKDAEGNTLVSYNVARNAKTISVSVANELADAFEAKLHDSLIEAEAKKKARTVKAKQTAAEREQKELVRAIKTLESAGLPVPPELKAKAAELKLAA